jgi:hypothetical protein
VIALGLSTSTVAVILVLVGIILFALFFSLSLLRANRQAEPAEKPVPVVSRREFQRRALISSVLLFSAEFGLGTVAFLWPNLRGGFGSKINAGSVNDIKSFIEGNKQPYYVGQGRFYVVEWNGTPGTGQANYPALQVTAQGDHAALPALRAPRVPGAVLPAVPMVRVPVSRVEIQRRR